MPDIFGEAVDWFHDHHHLHDQGAAAPSQTVTLHPHHETETPSMTTPPQRNVFADLASSLGAIANVLTEVAGNDLIAKLGAEKLGEQLAPGDAEHVIALVRSLEGRQAQAAPPLPQRPVEPATGVMPNVIA